MREIKFRAWSEKRNSYLSALSTVTFENSRQGIYSASFIAGDGCEYHHLGDELIFEQYTGLIDMDGKEIYDGDILEERITILNENKEPEQLEPHLHFMEWYVDDIGSGWTVWPREVWYSKIIGNKHQNPDLWDNRPMAQVEKDRENDILLTNAMKGIKNENL